MQTRLIALHTPWVALALAAGPAAVSAIELGRQDLTAPGALISICGGISTGNGYAVGDKGSWLSGRVNCNAQQTSSPNVILTQAADYSEAPVTVNTQAHGQAVMGQSRLFAHSAARNDAGIAQAEATAGWVDRLTLNPVNPAFIGQTALLSFEMDVSGTLSGQGAVDSFNSGAQISIRPYLNGLAFAPGPMSSFTVGGQGQWGSPYNQTVNQVVTFATAVTLGTPFTLGVFDRVIAGNASHTFGAPFAFSEATVDFSHTITWTGISALTLNGSPLSYTLESASGIDWTRPYAAAVPEPATWVLMAAGLLGLAARRSRQRRPDPAND